MLLKTLREAMRAYGNQFLGSRPWPSWSYVGEGSFYVLCVKALNLFSLCLWLFASYSLTFALLTSFSPFNTCPTLLAFCFLPTASCSLHYPSCPSPFVICILPFANGSWPFASYSLTFALLTSFSPFTTCPTLLAFCFLPTASCSLHYPSCPSLFLIFILLALTLCIFP